MTYSDKLVHIQVVIFVMTLRGDVVEVSDLIFTLFTGCQRETS